MASEVGSKLKVGGGAKLTRNLDKQKTKKVILMVMSNFAKNMCVCVCVGGGGKKI